MQILANEWQDYGGEWRLHCGRATCQNVDTHSSLPPPFRFNWILWMSVSFQTFVDLLEWPISIHFRECKYAHYSGNSTFKQKAFYCNLFILYLNPFPKLLAWYQFPKTWIFQELKQTKSWTNWNELVMLVSGVRPDLTSHWRNRIHKEFGNNWSGA